MVDTEIRTDRLEVVDALRGYALFGLLMVHMFAATIWYRHFRYGPLEWTWRAGTLSSLKVPFRI